MTNTETADILLSEARGWLADCSWQDIDAEGIAELTDAEILAAVRRHYPNGWRGFVADCAELVA